MKYIPLLLFCTMPFLCLAQQNQYGWRIGVHTGATAYYGDLSLRLIDGQAQLLQNYKKPQNLLPHLSHAISLEKTLNRHFALRAFVSQGSFTASDRTLDWQNNLLYNNTEWARSLNVRTELRDAALMLTYYTDKGRAIIAPYFSIGIGGTQFKTFADLYDTNGSRYFYNDGDQLIRTYTEGKGFQVVEQDGVYETELAPLTTEQPYPNTTLHIPAALGFKIRLGSRLNLNIEALARYTFTDYLDDISGNYKTIYDSPAQQYAANPTKTDRPNRGRLDDKYNDMYGSFMLSLHYNFIKKSSDAVDFLPPVFYSSPVSLTLKKDSTLKNVPLAGVFNAADTLQRVYPLNDTTAISELRKLNTELTTERMMVQDWDLRKNNTEELELLKKRIGYLQRRQTYFNDFKQQLNSSPKSGFALEQYATLLAQMGTMKAELDEVKKSINTLQVIVPTNNTIGATEPIIENATKKPSEFKNNIAPTTEAIIPKPIDGTTKITAPQQKNSETAQKPQETAQKPLETATNTANDAAIQELRNEIMNLRKQISTNTTAVQPAAENREVQQLRQRISELELLIATKNNSTADANTLALQRQIAELATIIAAQKNDKTAFSTATEQPATVPKTVMQAAQIFFQSGKSSLNSSQHNTLNSIVAQAQANTNAFIGLYAYTDRSGSATANAHLARLRANAVRNYLIQHGISPQQVGVVFTGVDAEAKSNSPNSRRVEVKWQ